MIGLVVLLFAAWNFYIGYRRGLFLQGYYAAAALISLCLASVFYKDLGKAIYLWVPYSSPGKDASISFFLDVDLFSLDKVYYAGVAFFAIYVGSYYALRLIGILMHLVDLEKWDQTRLRLISGAIAVLVSLLPFSMAFNILATLPLSPIQSILSSSWTAHFLIDYFIPFSSLLHMLWTSAV
ncbi:CvpA family protein [Streptococcus dentiloxodontae]